MMVINIKILMVLVGAIITALNADDTKISWNATGGKCTRTLPQTPVVDDNTGTDVSGDFDPDSCYTNGQVPYKEQCRDEYPFSKKRWTPAEATQWLNENDNTVTITFKKIKTKKEYKQ